LFVNFLTALTAILGGIIALLLKDVQGLTSFLLPFAAGSFIYIAGSDLIPELHKETEVRKSLIQLLAFILGIVIMFSLLLVG
jgi:zinc and cadmium transporter